MHWCTYKNIVNFDKYVLISKDTGNERKFLNGSSLNIIMHKSGRNDRLGPDSVQNAILETHN